MKRAACLLLLALLFAAPDARAGEMVVLVHGLLRSERAMRPLAEALTEAGYRTHALSYPSTELAPDALVEHLAREIDACCAEAARLHFVTHSLGGLLVRGYLAKQRPASLGRVVMLAPPNHGSEWVDRYGGNPLFRWLLGPTAVQLGTGPESFARRLPPADYEVGVIAGTTSRRPGASRVLLGASDGTVSVASTRLAGMTDFVKVPESHTFIMRSDAVAAQVRAFLESGRFAPTSAGSSAGTPRTE
jgi:pimeloyl-ACP methyl ester carboxylesterase